MKLIFSVHPEYVCKVMSRFVSCSDSISNMTIQARVYGKESSTPIASECRAILPLPAMLCLADCLMSFKLQQWADTRFTHIPNCFVGGRQHTQCLGIAHAVHLVIEKGLDMHSAGAVVTSDVKRFYDSISVVRVARLMKQRGCNHALIAAMIRCQMFPTIYCNLLSCRVVLKQRSLSCSYWY